MTVRVLVPSGVLGLGFDADALARGLEARPDVIAIDGGSTDSGPAYLGTGTSKYARSTIRAEWRALLAARRAAGAPLVIGSVGTCGTDGQVDAMVRLTDELAREAGERLRVATVRSEQRRAELLAACDAGRVHALPGGAPATHDPRAAIAEAVHVVALAGAEPIAAALATGADVVIAGRCTDTALISALPIARGEHAGAAWHAAKIAECGALCSTRPSSGTVMVEIDATGFTVRAFGEGARCTPYTVSAHMLYENADPYVLHEPGGRLDVTGASYVDAGNGAVRVEGSRWIPDERYTLKLEGARVAGHQVTSLVLVREPRYVELIDAWCDSLAALIRELARTQAGATDADCRIELRRIGVDATLGALEAERGSPIEVGVLLLVTAATPELALDVARLANPHLLHHPLPGDESLPSFAFPYSPAETVRGPVHEFCLDHVLVVDGPTHGTRLDTLTVGVGS